MHVTKKPITIEERVLRLEYDKETTDRHLNEVREISKKTSEDVTDIKNAIIGNSMNGDYGIVHSVKDIKEKQDSQEDILLTHKLYFKQIGVFIGAIVAVIVGLIIRVFSK